MDGKKFDELLLKFAKTEVGKRFQSDMTIGFINDKLVYFQIKV